VLESGTNKEEAIVSRDKGLGIVVLAVGLVLLLGSALADIMGVGASPLVFGYRQLAGSAVGAVLVIIGALLYWRASRGS
jgi:hypothetical protein